jgi:hypothetical protein
VSFKIEKGETHLSTTAQLRSQLVKSLQQDQKNLTKELAEVNSQLAALNGHGAKATVAFADTAHHEVKKTRHMSAAGRAAISRATKKRWAKIRAEKKANSK